MNHWISAKGPPDVCMACGEKVPNAGGTTPPLAITGECPGVPRTRADRLVLVVCRRCADRPPYFGKADLDIVLDMGRGGWCVLCRRWMGDDYVTLPKRAPATELVQAFVDAVAAIGGSHE
jgi:hypothetical protein